MHESRVYYNLVEANAAVPRLELLFAELGKIQRRVNTLALRARRLGVEIDLAAIEEGKASPHPVRRRIERRLLGLSRDYSEGLKEIERLGVVIGDLELGIVNFYSWHDGREIFLSWQFGEPEVAHWHAVTEAPAARQSFRRAAARRPSAAFLH